MNAGKEISHELWETLFEDANWAPNHGLTEPWRFLVHTGESRAQIASALQNAYKSETLETDFRPEKFEKMGKNPFLANSVVVIRSAKFLKSKKSRPLLVPYKTCT